MMSLPSLGGMLSFAATCGVLPLVSMLTTAGSTFFAISVNAFDIVSGCAVRFTADITNKMNDINITLDLYLLDFGIILMDITPS